MNLPAIPSVDLSDFRSGFSSRRQEFVVSLGRAFEQTGFVTIRNHGFTPLLEAKLHHVVKSFFDLPADVKKGYEFPDINRQRGYTSFGREHAKNHNAGDLKEFWHFGQYLHPADDLNEIYPKNIQVAELPNFNEVGKQAFQQLEEIGLEILRAIALFLELPEHYFHEYCVQGNSILRPIHYPPITNEPQNAFRAAAHEDINLITLLMGASSEGLQVLSKEGKWVPITAFPGYMVVNVGDMIQRLTNNQLRSTTHRVVNPPRQKWHEPRYSIPFFLHPVASMPLNCLDSCITDYNPKNYDDITAGEYLNERLREIGLIDDNE